MTSEFQVHVELITTALELRALELESEPDATAVAEVANDLAALKLRLAACSAKSSLFERLGLTPTESVVVWSLAALAVSGRACALLAQATADGKPTLRAIQTIVYGDDVNRMAFEELGTTGTLRRLGVIEGVEAQTWTISRRVLAFLHGVQHIDPMISHACSIESGLPTSRLAVAAGVVDRLRYARATRTVVLVAGMEGIGRRTVQRAIATSRGIQTLTIDAKLLASGESFGRQLRAIALECKLLDRVPLIANIDALDAERLALVGSELVAQLDGLVLATSGVNRPAIRWDRPTIVVEMGKPSSEQIGKLWLKELGQGSESDAELLASQYPLAPALIHHAAQAAKARAGGAELTPEDIYAGIRTVLDDRLGQYARRVTVTQTWDDLVLPQDQIDSVVELMARVRGRRKVYEQWGFGAKVGKGLGVTALFSGPPGTGKTMVAALIARDLGLELYQVDLGKVVSKWIGETEKNLAAVFDAAEAGHAVLLFDEADALFGKRTDVKSSNDRHANLETNYLLQRLESFTGICLLTSNHESHIDSAFQRRLSLHLRFEIPDAEERTQLWRAMLPTAAPVAEGIDFADLARRYAMTGGYIRNAALRAAFLAADTDASITMALLDHAARVEYAGMGKIV